MLLLQCDLGEDTDDEPHEYAVTSTQIKDATFDEDTQARLAVLSYEQVCRLNDVMEETVSGFSTRS